MDRVYFGVFSLLLYIYDRYVRSAHSALATHSVAVSRLETFSHIKRCMLRHRSVRISNTHACNGSSSKHIFHRTSVRVAATVAVCVRACASATGKSKVCILLLSLLSLLLMFFLSSFFISLLLLLFRSPCLRRSVVRFRHFSCRARTVPYWRTAERCRRERDGK